MTAGSMWVPYTKIFPNACRLRIKMTRISWSLRALYAFIFLRKEGQCRILSYIHLRPPTQLPLASGESSQASCEDIFRTTCRETPNPNAASGRKKGGSQSKNYEICLRLSEAQAQKLRQDAKDHRKAAPGGHAV